MRRVNWSDASPAARAEALARPPRGERPEVADGVARIFADVRARGAEAVAGWATKLDGFAPRTVAIAPATLRAARSRVSREDAEALVFAADAVRRFHQADRPQDGPWVNTIRGARCRRVWRPIETAGLYVPGGTAPLFSTLLMLAIPAEAAGVPVRVAVTPPGRGGEAHPMMVLAAELAGLDALHLVGGAQAIAAMTFGAGLPRAEKIFGPGNAWVAEAKRQAAALAGGPAIDLPAGPSELVVIADGTADPTFVAADLLSQAEHDADAQVLLVTNDARAADAVEHEVERLVARLPRAETARASLASARVLLTADLDEAVRVADAYAPEHLSIQTRDAGRLAAAVRNAGTVFVGHWSAESFGDYLAGPSHVLPTDGAARAFSGVTTASFMKSFAVQEVRPEAVPALAEAATRLAKLEGLEAHALAAELRGERARGLGAAA